MILQVYLIGFVICLCFFGYILTNQDRVAAMSAAFEAEDLSPSWFQVTVICALLSVVWPIPLIIMLAEYVKNR